MTLTIEPQKVEQFNAATLLSGAHMNRKAGGCIMEWVGYLAGEPWGDQPQCVDPALRSFCIRLNDRWNEEERQLLKPLAMRLIGTNVGRETSRARARALVDWSVRELTPLWLGWIGQEALAAELRALHPILAAEHANLALPLLRGARAAAAAAAYAYAAYAAAAYADAADAAAAAAYAADAADAAYAAAAAYAAYAAAAAYAADAAYAAAAAGRRREIVTASIAILDRVIDIRVEGAAE